STRLKLFRKKIELLVEFYTRARARLLNTPELLEELNSQDWLTRLPKDLSEEEQQLSRDLDIFGSYSLWSNISEVFSVKGFEKLKGSLISPPLDASAILKKQKRVELTSRYS